MKRINPIVVAAATLVAIAAGLFIGRTVGDARQSAPTNPLAPVIIEVAEPAAASSPAGEVVVDVEETPAPEPTPAEPAATDGSAQQGPDLDAAAETFVADFSAAHDAAAVEVLVDGLHPAMNAAFGEEACVGYVEATVGSVTDMRVISVGEPTDFTLDSPAGEIALTEAIPVTAEWTVVHSGENQRLLFHLGAVDGELHWLTTCGWQAPNA